MLRFVLSLIFAVALLIADSYAPSSIVEKAAQKYDKFAKNRFVYMNNTLETLRDKSDAEKLEGVNNFFNDVRYSSDMKLYGKSDYWATPWEFMGHDKGDCEDYVIAKYFALKYLGVDTKKLYFSYVKSKRFKQPHMVLTYFETPKSIPLVLDNTNFKIFPANQRTDLIPIYNFNGETLNLASKSGEHGKQVKSPKTHKKWDELVKNIQRNKL